MTGGTRHERNFPVPEKFYPSSVIALYPVVHGLRLGHEYAFAVYDGQTQTMASIAGIGELAKEAQARAAAGDGAARPRGSVPPSG